MKTAFGVAIGLAVLVALAGVVGFALVAPGGLPGPFGGSTPSAGTNSGGTGGNGGGSAGVGTLDVYVQDAPAGVNWTHVWVTFSELQAHEANATDADGWLNMTITQETVDLASLTSVSQLLGTATLPTGTYTQLRIVVMAASGEMANGTKVTFTVPSGELRTDDPFVITAGGTTSLTVDIDLSRSIVHADGTWLFTPVLGAVKPA